MNIVVLDTATVADEDVKLDFLSQYGQVTAYYMSSQEEVPHRIQDADLVLINKVHLGETEMDAAPRLKYIGLFATGYNNVDIQAARRRGIAVCNVPGYSTEAVAQHTFALILSLASSIPQYSASVHAGDWVRSKQFTYFKYPQTSLIGKTLGIFGCGAIGKRVAAIGEAFGMRVLAHTRTPENCPYTTVDTETLFQESDVLSFHCPLTEENRGVICKETLSLMKPSALLINTARGGLAVEQDLADALNNGGIAGAGIDVLCAEPMHPNNPLLNAKNCILTPHVAWAPPEVREKLVGLVAENVQRFINGTPHNVVNP